MSKFLDISLSDDFELKVDRVGDVLSYLEDAEVGETVQFYYKGGSAEGDRTVLVYKRDKETETIEGPTLERNGEYRAYQDSKVHGTITVVEPFVKKHTVAAKPVVAVSANRIRFDKAVDSVVGKLTVEELVKLYQDKIAKSGETVHYDVQSGEIVVEPQMQVKQNYQMRSFTLTQGNKSVRIELTSSDKIRLAFIENNRVLFDNSTNDAKLIKEKLLALYS